MQKRTFVLLFLIVVIQFAKAAAPAAPTQPSQTSNCGNTVLLYTGSTPTYVVYYYQGTNASGTSTSTPMLDGSTATGVTIYSSGSYYIRAKNIENLWSSSILVSVTVKTVPAAPTANAVSRCGSGSITLNGSSTTPGVVLEWYENNSLKYTGDTYTLTISSSTPYQAKSLLNGCRSSSIDVQATVNPIPTATATNNSPVCEGANLTLTGGAAGLTYSWSGPGFSSTLQSPVVSTTATLGEAGTYTLTVKNGNNCQNTASTTVTINPLPRITSQPSSLSLLYNASATFSITASNATSYQWKKNGSNITGATSSCYTISSVAAGDFADYTCTATNGCGTTVSNAATLNLDLSPPNTPSSPTVTNNCGQSIVSYSGSAPTNVTYYWQTSASGISTSSPMLAGSTKTDITVTSSGTYYVRAKNTNNGVWSVYSVSVSITLKTRPAIPTTITPSATEVCSGGNISFSASCSTPGVSYDWYQADTFKMNGTTYSPSFANSRNSNSSVEVRAYSTLNGCASSGYANDTVTVKFLPPVPTSISATPTSTYLYADVNFTAACSTNTNVVNYDWYEGSTLKGSGESTYKTSFSTTGTKTIYAYSNLNGCASTSSISKSVTINALVSINWKVLKALGLNASTQELSKNSTSTSWGSMEAVSASELLPNAGGLIYHSAIISNDYVRVGFSDGMETSPEKMDHCFEMQGSNLRAYNKNVQQGTTTTTLTTGTIIKLKRSGDDIQLFLNNNTDPTYTWKGNANIAYRMKVICKRNGGGTENIGLTKVTFNSVAQTCTINASNNNYIHTVTPKTATALIPANTTAREAKDYSDRIDYFDGLGRIIQNIDVCNSPSGESTILPHAYDNVGRENKQYLPFTTKGLSGYLPGSYESNALSSLNQGDQDRFYANAVDNNIVATNYAFSETMFDNSPLNRPVEQSYPGASWKIGEVSNSYRGYQEFVTKGISGTYSGHTSQILYSTNILNEVYKFTISGNTLKATGQYYAAGTIYKTISRNENWVSSGNSKLNSTEEFKDLKGRVLLKRNYDNSANPINTYYVYDDFDLLRYVISPLAVSSVAVATATDFTLASDIIKNLCYYYEYDGRKRMVIKQLPGAQAIYMVYDNWDRLVATQDGVQRLKSPKEWTFTKYDQLNRPIMTGLYTTSSDFGPVQDLVKTFTVFGESRGTTLEGYTNNCFPKVKYGGAAITSSDILTVTYYDDYTFTGVLAPSSTYKIDDYVDNDGISNGYFDRVTGNITGTKIRVMDDMSKLNWILSTMYYDDKYRVIQQVTDYSTSVTDNTQKLFGDTGYNQIISNRYSFDGRILMNKDRQLLDGTITEVNKYYVYDNGARLTQVYNEVVGDNTNGLVLASEMEYNEIGQLKTKQLHVDAYGNGLQKIDYKYNERGWLKSINDPGNLAAGSDLFGESLSYESPEIGSGAQYNGNISATVWSTDATSAKTRKGYSFVYDKLNRLTASTFYEYSSSSWTSTTKYQENIQQYDYNGNINVLLRFGATNNCPPLGVYGFSYTGNQISSLTVTNYQQGPPYGSSSSTCSYVYDQNGNCINDGLRGMSITYNLLNLPATISKSNETIKYIYTATGTKIAKQLKSGSYQYYLGNSVYDNSKMLNYMLFEEGRISNISGGAQYEYNIKDHLGNTRVVFKPNGTSAAVLQVADYYPFGMNFSPISPSNDNKYLYNGKEKQDDNLGGTNLDWYDYGARFYDPQIGRWTSIDPLAEKNRRWNPYCYTSDDPMNRIDPDGMTDFTLNQQTGAVAQVGQANKEPDRILKTDNKGNVKLKGSGLLGFTVRKSEVGKPKVAIGGIEQGILQNGQNFRTNDNIIAVGGTGQPSVEGVKSFTLQLSEYVGKEIKGFSYSSNASGKVTDMLLGKYINNGVTESRGSVSELAKKYGNNFSFNNVLQEFHTHPNGELGATQSAPGISADVKTLQTDKPFIPNASFIILYRITGQEAPGEYDYTHEYRPTK